MRPYRISHRHYRFIIASAVGAATALLTGCADFPRVGPSAKPVERIALSMPDGIGQARDAWPQDDWWTAFGDPQLNRLIQRALDASPNLATAQARIARAQAAVEFNRGANAPQVSASAEASYGRQSENYLMPKPPLGKGGESVSQGLAALNFGYDIDLWDRNAALIRSTEAQLKAARFDRDAAQLALTTAIARTYAQLAAQYELQEVLLATQEQRQAIRKLASQRVANGLDTNVELRQAETGEAALRVDLTQLATSIDITRLQLAALTGDMPDTARNINRPALSGVPFSVPQNLPLDLLSRRPELAAQRARIASATEETQAAKAQFYPNINLNGLVGFQAIGLGQLLSPGSMMSSIGPAVHLPIFEGGRLRANYAARNADVDAAITQYNQSIVTAAQDVAEQLARVASLTREEQAAREALSAAEEAHRLAMLRYRAGLSPYLTVLSVETQLLAQRRVLVDLKAKRQDLQIALVRALGGGFSDAAAQSVARAEQH